MAPEIKKEIQLEIGHVLFVDIVGYSKLSTNDQHAAVEELNQVVRATDQSQRAEAAGRMLKIPTGDGMALVFYTSPETPAQCAVEISRALKDHPRLELRMGIHSGPVSGVVDVNERANLAGAGINMAQRVMDCGDAGHILLSKHAAEDLEEYEQWRPRLHDLGTCEAKHGVRVSVVNLYDDQFGNARLPRKLESVRKHRARVRWAGVAFGLLVLAAVVGAFIFLLRRPTHLVSAIAEKSIAVLPFENLSRDPDNAYFADGIQDEILTRLSRIADLKVISRTSTQRYKSVPENLPEIARQLGVVHILEGSVQKAADQVRVNVQLIQAQKDSHLWAETYDRKLSDIFAVESEVAQNIADSLRANLSLEEKARVQKKPTANPIAYDLYLQARAYHNRALANIVRQDFDNAQRLYERALVQDPQFALAHAQLSATLGAIFHWFEPTEQVKTRGRQEAEESLKLDSDLGEGHLALGLWLYWTERRYDEALKEFNFAMRALPGNVDILTYVAAIERRTGKWAEATSTFQRALALDPRNPSLASEMMFTLTFQRQWAAASQAAQLAVALGPDLLNLRIRAAYTDFWWRNDTTAVHNLLDSIPVDVDPDGLVTLTRWDLAMLERSFDAAQGAIDAGKVDPIIRYGAPVPKSYLQGDLDLARGDFSKARPSLELARQYLEQEVQRAPDDPVRRAPLAHVYSYLGRNDDAIREAKLATQLLPESRDAIIGPAMEATLALVYARAGKNDDAIALISRLLTVPGSIDVTENNMTIPDLKRRWQWDPLRTDPRFQKLITTASP